VLRVGFLSSELAEQRGCRHLVGYRVRGCPSASAIAERERFRGQGSRPTRLSRVRRKRQSIDSRPRRLCHVPHRTRRPMTAARRCARSKSLGNDCSRRASVKCEFAPLTAARAEPQIGIAGITALRQAAIAIRDNFASLSGSAYAPSPDPSVVALSSDARRCTLVVQW